MLTVGTAYGPSTCMEVAVHRIQRDCLGLLAFRIYQFCSLATYFLKLVVLPQTVENVHLPEPPTSAPLLYSFHHTHSGHQGNVSEAA